MTVPDQLPENLQKALNGGVVKRLPLTFLPFVNQQLREWIYLFPNERRSVERLLIHVASLNDEASTALFREVVDLEDKMGVRKWKFSTDEQTIENSSMLARAAHYQDWRRAVQAVFDAAERYAQESGSRSYGGNRLVLIEIPAPLTPDATKVWRRWRQLGTSVQLDVPPGAQRGGLLRSFISEPAGNERTSLLDAIAASGAGSSAEAWIVDAGSGLVDPLLTIRTSDTSRAKPILLSYSRLNEYRRSFSHEMNTMRKDLSDADAVYDRLRKVDVVPWCPPEMASDPAVREFVRALYLSGNGAVIFGNSFVEWAASEIFRRARPRFVAARFGLRAKPKPFTGVAVFEDPDRANPMPAVDDLPGSALDAEVLALYIWLAASRYEEYQRSTVCVCVAETLSQAYVIAPKEFEIAPGQSSVSTASLKRRLQEWMA